MRMICRKSAKNVEKHREWRRKRMKCGEMTKSAKIYGANSDKFPI